MNTETKEMATTGSGLIAMAINANLDIEKLERLMEMKEREEEKTAKAAFNVAMAVVQKNIEPIIADGENTQTDSRFSKLTTIVSTLAPIYTREGFSVSGGTSECSSQKLVDAGWFRTTAELSHVGGYTKDYYVDLPADTCGPKGNINKTVIHGTKSSITYARVILMGLMFNFTTSHDVDDDGNGAGPTNETITPEQAAALRDEIAEVGGEEGFFCNWLCKVRSCEDIPDRMLAKAQKAIAEQKAVKK